VSVVDGVMRDAIEVRAEFRCEYCRLPVRGQIATFPIESVPGITRFTGIINTFLIDAPM
jgi:hypothetical protein